MGFFHLPYFGFDSPMSRFRFPEWLIPSKRVAWILTGVLGVTAVLFLSDDYGVSWDEPAHSHYGELAVDYFASGGKDQRVNEYYNLKYYGSLVDMVAATAYRFHPKRKYETRHLVLGILALLIAPGLIVYTRKFGDPLLPLFALTALLMFPRFVGHVFHNSKDVPFATAVVWFMATTVAVFVLGKSTWRHIAGAGVAMGLALSVRPGSFLLLALFFLAMATLARFVGPRTGDAPSLGTRLRRDSILVLAWIVMLIPWPWAHRSPIGAPLRAMRLSLLFPENYPVLFEGHTVLSNQLPGYYLPKYLLITTPPTLLFLAALGISAAVVCVVRRRRTADAVMSAITLMWLFVPLSLFVVRHPPIYDGIRHFLFLLPAFAVLAALGAVRLLRAVERRAGRIMAWGLVTVLLLFPARELVRLHPYQMTYFNGLVGGVSGASTRYETDYWVLSYKEAVEWINDRVAPYPDRSFRVLASGSQFVKEVAAYEAAPNLEIFTRSELWDLGIPKTDMDFYIGTTRYRNDEDLAEAPIAHVIGKEGAVFTVIRQVQPLPRESRSHLDASGNHPDGTYSPAFPGLGRSSGRKISKTTESLATGSHVQLRR